MHLLLTLALAAAPPRYVALGDSFTIGTGSRPEQAFPARLAARWSCPVTVANPARNGFTTQDLLDHELTELTGASLITLAIGANDIVRGASDDAYRRQIGRIYDALAAAGVPAGRVWAIPQPDWSRSPVAAAFGDPAALHTRIDTFNTILREVSTARGARWVDLTPLLAQQAERGMIAGDGLHPSAEAYDAWAAALAKELPDPCAPREARGG
ncbi:MAG TPA: SGNH/GDSL hydrolase family protein [Myxococcota bacterium]|nr:SGNH/GDSL hydrolase family protein [Myxococcota bacterium]